MPQQPLAQVPMDAQWYWQDHGACRDYDSTLFFHPQNERGSARMKRDRAAKLVCASCTVQTTCREFARTHHEYGLWGGESEDERHEAGYRLIAPIGIRAAS